MATAAITILPADKLYHPSTKVRLGIIGTGFRGQNHLDNALRRADVDVVAICDVDDRMLQMTADLIKKIRQGHATSLQRRSLCIPKTSGTEKPGCCINCHTLGVAWTHDTRRACRQE